MSRVIFGLAAVAVSAAFGVAPATAELGKRGDLSDRAFDAADPVLAANSSGAAIAVWRERRGDDWIVRSAARRSGGDWGAAESLSRAGGSAESAQLAIAADGSAAVVWQRAQSGRTVVQAVVRSATGPWSDPQDLSDPAQSAFNPDVAITATGAVTVVWTRLDGFNGVVQSSHRTVGGTWSTPVTLSQTGRTAYEPQVAVDETGGAVAVWWRSDGSYAIVQSAARVADGTWAAPVNVSTPGGNASSPGLAMTSSGLAIAIWRRATPNGAVIETAERPAGGAWTNPAIRSRGPALVKTPQLAVLGSTTVVASWRSDRGLFVSRRTASGFRQPEAITAAFDTDDSIAFDPDGNIVTVNGGLSSAVGVFEPLRGDNSATFVALSECFEGESLECFSAYRTNVAFVGKGEAVAVYLHSRAARDVVQTVTFDRREPPPPPDVEDGEEPPVTEDALRITNERLRVRGRAAFVPVACPAKARCVGRVVVRRGTAERGTPRYAYEARRAPVQGRAAVRLRGTKTARALVRLSPRLARALAREGQLRTIVVLEVTTGRRTYRERKIVTLVADAAWR